MLGASLTVCRLWNCILTVITPYLVNPNQANLQSKVFFIWGSTCVLCFIYAYLTIWETKGLTLEQVDRMMEETGSPRRSAGWKAHSTFAHDMGLDASGKMQVPVHERHDEKASTDATGTHASTSDTPSTV